MEANLAKVIQLRISRTIEALEKNNMKTLYVPGKEEAKALLGTLLEEGQSISVGGSVTLNQIGAFDIIRDPKFNFIDRYEKGLSEDELEFRRIASLSSDVFICSSNAITENGYLYNVDGTGNRISSIIFGPKKVIIIAGYNKIVSSLSEAVNRVKNISAPANTIRLDKDSFCSKHGHCYKDKCDENELMCNPAGSCNDCICCSSLVSGQQRIKDRITVILVGEALGY